jgi:hypothetical protein
MNIPALDYLLGIHKADGWAESKHPRAANGQFGSGGSGKGKESAGAKHKRNQQARRAEGTGQTTLGGGKAIQSLLSGGSALDKIGWLNTSKKPDAAKGPETPAKEPAKVPAANIKSAKDTIRENLKSGKLKKETVIAAVRSLYEQANEAESKGDDATAKKLDQQAEVMTDAADIKGELYLQGILQIRGSPSHIGPGIPARQSSAPKKPTGAKIPPEGIWTGRGPRPAPDPEREAEIRRLGPAPKPNNSLETSHRIDAYRNKVISQGKQLDSFKEGEQDLGLYEHNGKTYFVDHDRSNQFAAMSHDEWRRMKDELAGDEGPRAATVTPPKHKPTTTAPKSPHVTDASSSDIMAQGKNIDAHGNKTLHEYNGGFYMVTEGNPTGRKVSKPAWESMKYD